MNLRSALFLRLSGLFWLLTAAVPAQEECLDCHADPGLSVEREGERFSLFTDPAQLQSSAHSLLDCVDCHGELNGARLPHADPLPAVDCRSCHEDLAASHAFHPAFLLDPIPERLDTDCVSCHGSHATAAQDDPAWPFTPARLAASCAECHEEESAHFLASAHGQHLQSGDPEAPHCLTCHREAPPRQNGDPVHLKLAQSALCTSCHLDNPNIVGKTLLGDTFIASWNHSVHELALKAGKPEAANCVDCHGSHEMNRAMVADSKVSKAHLAETCAACHTEENAAFQQGAHAAALAQGHLGAPHCGDCHGEHDILKTDDPLSPVSARNLSQMLCGDCHGSVRLSEKYGLASDRFQTFNDSFHGLAVRGGAVEAVNCASCHGFHDIRPSSDPLSPVHKANLAATCGECHPGANARFAVGSVHVALDRPGEDPVLYWIATLYVFAIVLIVGGMFFHNLLDFIKKIRRKIALQKGLLQEEILPHRLYLRMNVNERLQHGSLVLSFVLLVITGFMLRYPEAWWVEGIRSLNTHAFEYRGLLHRLAAIVMVLAGCWHAAYLAFTPRGRRLFLDLLPRLRDFHDVLGVFRYNLGLAPSKPRFGRFSYIEKAEYWALIWGSVLMTITGVFLWFENTTMGLFTKLGYDISRTVHFYEAILATLAIIVWHFYFVIFNPDVYPMNLSWLTGYLSEKEMAEEHPAELERLRDRPADPRSGFVPSAEQEKVLTPPPQP